MLRCLSLSYRPLPASNPVRQILSCLLLSRYRAQILVRVRLWYKYLLGQLPVSTPTHEAVSGRKCSCRGCQILNILERCNWVEGSCRRSWHSPVTEPVIHCGSAVPDSYLYQVQSVRATSMLGHLHHFSQVRKFDMGGQCHPSAHSHCPASAWVARCRNQATSAHS